MVKKTEKNLSPIKIRSDLPLQVPGKYERTTTLESVNSGTKTYHSSFSTASLFSPYCIRYFYRRSGSGGKSILEVPNSLQQSQSTTDLALFLRD